MKHAAKEVKGFSGEPIKENVHALRAGTTLAKGVELLAKGGTVKEFAKLDSAGNHRSFLNYMRTMTGYGFKSTDGVNVKIVYPAGMKKPLPVAVAASEAVAPKAKKKAA